jgi:diguanylate cyclase (GGDEF)-like protein
MTQQKQKENDNSLEPTKLTSCLQLGKLLTSTLKLSEILELIMLKASQIIEAENWSLLLKDESSGELTFEVVVGLDKNMIKDVRLKPGQGIAGKVAQSGEPVFISDAEEDPQIDRTVDKLCGFTTRSIICLPLQIHGKILGVIEIINIDDIEQFKVRDLPALSILTDYAAIAIQNSMYVSKIEQMSIIDEYTGLYNARYMHEKLQSLIQRSLKENKSLAVIFMDIDNFKQVVDTYGHLQGSRVLNEIGQTLSASLSERDYLFKYGGDEYVIALPDRDKAAAVKQTETMLEAIRSSTYLQNENHPVKVTASFGIAMYPEDAQTKKELLLKADNLMYHVKKTSKNSVAAAE